jgi:hypothetical protein
MPNKITVFIISFLMTCILPLGASAAEHDDFLDKVERQAFDYFIKETFRDSGLTLNTTEECAPATNAASGFMLSALVIGAERGWITQQDAYSLALKTLRTFRNMEKAEGFTYHYFNVRNCGRMWSSEISCIDTAIFLAGAITVGEYFKNTEVESIADELYRQTNWQWFLDGEKTLQLSWKPEKGFSGRIDSFSEGILCYILAMGSPTYAISPECWDSFARPVSTYDGYRIIYVYDGSLFQYLFPLAWLDLRDKHDKYADYWQNAVKAIRANKKFCRDKSESFLTYKEGFWGLSASLSPNDGYKNFGAKPGRSYHEGTVAPYAVAGSVPLVPEFAITDYKNMYDKLPNAIDKYGLTDAFNIGQKWASPYYISIDQGLTLLMIENYRSGLIWKYFMRNKYVKKGLESAGFEPGWQGKPSEICTRPGNPDDKIIVDKITAPKIIDGDISKWEKDSRASKIVLTTKDYRNVEMMIGYIKDDASLSGVFYLGHDGSNLYIAGRVKDDNIVTSETRSSIYRGSCIELYFDTNRDGFYFDKNPHDYQFGFAPSGPGLKPQAWAWGNTQRVPDNITYAAKLTDNGYAIEIKIPFEAINGFGFDKNRTVGFSISIHGKNKKGKPRKLSWSIDSFSQPGKIFFGTLELKDFE